MNLFKSLLVVFLLAMLPGAAAATPASVASVPATSTSALSAESGGRAAPRVRGHYIVFEIDAADHIKPVFYRQVEMQERTMPSDTEFMRAGADIDQVVVSGKGWRQVADIPMFVRGEFARNGVEGEIEEHQVLARSRSFVLRIPEHAGNDLQLQYRGRTSAVRVDQIASQAETLALAGLARTQVHTAAVSNSGNRVDILVVGDGYQSSEQSRFSADAQNLHDSMFSVSPYQHYSSFLNWTTLFVASAQSGVDHPPYQANCTTTSCCADAEAKSDPRAGTFVNTAFDGTFCTAQIHRLTTVDDSKVMAAASADPDWDEILVLLNDPVYGGSGGSLSVITTNENSALIVIHEYGHTFTRLADEYSSPYPGFPDCSDVSGNVPCEPNVTDQTSRSKIKWHDWIQPSTPIPTPAGSPDVGLFEGARYESTGKYRPQNTCTMQALGVPFCAVCSQEYVLRLYRGGWGVPAAGIDLIDPGTESPVPGAVTYNQGATQTFKATILHPSPDTVSLQWYLDGQPIAGATTAAYAFKQATAAPATRTLELRAFDATTLVNANVAALPANNMTHSRTWNIQVQPSTTLTIGDVSRTEGNSGTSVATFTVSLSSPATTPVTFDIATADGTATAGSDYVARSVTGMSIAAGKSSATFAVTIDGDTAVEPSETFFVNVSNASGANIGDGQATGTIVNDDLPSMTITDTTMAEGNSGTNDAFFEVLLSDPAPAPVTFDAATADGTAAGGSDYVPEILTGQTIAAGSDIATFTVKVIGDTTAEPNETFKVNLGNVKGATVAKAQGIGTINNDDLPVLSIADVAAPEGNSGTSLATFTVSLASAVSDPVSFDIATSDVTATAGSDYIARSLTSQVIPAGQTSKTFTVTIKGDALVEPNETFNATIIHADGIIGRGQATGTILNDDGPLLPSLSIADVSVNEGNSGTGSAVFTIRLSKPSANTVTYTVGVADGTAVAGSDYIAGSPITQSIPVGQTSTTFTVPIIGDPAVEPNETFTVNLGAADFATIARGQATGTIVNDDGPALSIGDATVTEGNSGTKAMTFTVKLSQASASAVGYNIATTDGTATAGSDYVASSLAAQSIPAGQTSKTFAVTIKGDAVVEPNETFAVNLAAPVGATIARGQAVGTIVNDDGPTLSIADASMAEGNSGTSPMSFTISLSQTSSSAVTFNVATTDGTATAGSDYIASSNLKPLSIPAGQTSAAFAVPIIGDTAAEPDETFFASISGASGASIVRGQAIGKIVNDDSSHLTAISRIQGNGLGSPLLGQSVAVQGIVTALSHDGFYLQAPDATRDGDPATSEGLFVATGASAARVGVAVGDQAQVSGQVQEATVAHAPHQLTLTRIAASKVSVVGRGRSLPSPVVLRARDLDARQSPTWLERYEGMRVSVPELMVVGPTEGSLREAQGSAIANGVFHAVPGGTPRPFVAPGMDALDHQTVLPVGVLPPVFHGNPQNLRIDSLGQAGALAMALDNGSTVSGLTGVLTYAAGAYTLLPDPAIAARVHAALPLRAVSEPQASETTIGSFNLRRLFDGNDDPSRNEPVLAGNAYTLRLAKTANAICAYARNPAILGVAEVENLSTLSDLASAINSNAGNVLFPASCKGDPGYRAYLLDGNDPEGLNIGFLVRADQAKGRPRVEVLSVVQLGKAASFIHRGARSEPLFEHPPLLLRARVQRADGQPETFTVIANHLSPSDGISDGASGWATRGDSVRAKRAAQATFLAAAIQSRQAADPGERIVVLGDFNATEFSDGYVDVMGIVSGQPARREDVVLHADSPVKPPLTDMTTLTPKAERYSVTQQGNAQALDHILVNQPLLKGGQALRTEYARIDADFGEDNAGDYAVPVRTSDHDPVVLYLGDPGRPSSKPCQAGAARSCSH